MLLIMRSLGYMLVCDLSVKAQTMACPWRNPSHAWLTSVRSPSRYTASNQPSGEGNGTPLQYSCLGNPMDRGAWWAAVHGVAKSRTWLNDFTFTFHFHALEKEMATHCSVLAWRIPGTGEPGGLPAAGSHRVRHDCSNSSSSSSRLQLTEVLQILRKATYMADGNLSA